jgi:YVTN family beta-propeller protein
MAAEGAVFQPLTPGLATHPDFTAGQAVATATSPDGNTLLILTSGYNRNANPAGQGIPEESNEYVFVYDISGNNPIKRQVLQVPNTFNGIAWQPNSQFFYVSGGVNDNIHVFKLNNGVWSEDGSPIALGHTNQGLSSGPMAAGLAVNASGTQLLVANFESDSVSRVDLHQRTAVANVDLRPGKIDSAQQGVPGGEYPFWVAIKGDSKAYVTSERDGEVVVLDLTHTPPTVTGRIPVGGQPNKMILNRAQTLLYVANGNSDSVSVIDVSTDQVIEEIAITTSNGSFSTPRDLTGNNPNSLALSPDEQVLYVTNGGTNSLAVIQLRTAIRRSTRVLGLIPTGWYPNSVSVSSDGSMLYIVNGKSNAGPNPGACRDTLSIAPGSLGPCSGRNAYVWQLTKAGFLTLPVPAERELEQLSLQVAANNHFRPDDEKRQSEKLMDFLRGRIKHVIYIVKENRTYDQILGDLEVGNGDPHLTVFPKPLTPNHHALARQFVDLDNFFDSGEVSGDGWNWTTAARTTDFTEKTVPINYAGRGLDYDWEGTSRNINVGYATLEERKFANPLTPSDPDLLPGATDVAAPDGPGGEAGTGYLWDGALRKGLTVRNYGFYGDLVRYSLPATNPNFIPVERHPFQAGYIQFFPTKVALQDISDPYFRGYDQNNADYWLFKEWEREFDQFAANGKLPALEFVRFPHDHFGNFSTAIDGVNTPDTQMADNDYAVGLLVEKISKSRYKNDTLIFVVEDDAQNGGDHVDAHRSIAYVVGPYVKQGAVVSTPYNTVSLVRTIEALLGLKSTGLLPGLSTPMADVFEKTLKPWTYTAIFPQVLKTTQLPQPTVAANERLLTERELAFATPRHDAAYWERVFAGQNFSVEDKLDTAQFNVALWKGLMGEDTPYPTTRHGRDLSHDRARLLREFWVRQNRTLTVAQAE